MDSVGVKFPLILERSSPSHQGGCQLRKRLNRPSRIFPSYSFSHHSSVLLLSLILSKLPSAPEVWIKSLYPLQLAPKTSPLLSLMMAPLFSAPCMSIILLPKSLLKSPKLKTKKSETEPPLLLFSPVNFSEKDKNLSIKECIPKPSLLAGERPETLAKINCAKLPETTPKIPKSSKTISSTLPKPHSAQSYWPKTNNILLNSLSMPFSDWRESLTFHTFRSSKNWAAQSKSHSSAMVWSWKKPFQLVARDLSRIVRFWHRTLPWTTTRWKFTEPESESNLWKRCKRFQKLKKWKWKKKLTELLNINQQSSSTDNSSTITQNSSWSKRESPSSNMQTLREFKESRPPSVQKFYRLLTVQKERMKFWELVIRLKKSWSVKTKLSSFQDAREMRHAQLSWEVHPNTFWKKLRDLCMMLCVFWFKLSKTNRSFTVEETLRFKWQLSVKSLPRSARAKKVLRLKLTEGLWGHCQWLLLKMQDSTQMSWSTI